MGCAGHFSIPYGMGTVVPCLRVNGYHTPTLSTSGGKRKPLCEKTTGVRRKALQLSRNAGNAGVKRIHYARHLRH